MPNNIRMWWRGRRRSMPLVQRDITRFSAVRDVSRAEILADSKGRRGRFAQNDQVATCLLRRNYASALPVRREMRVARNRGRLKFAFVLVCAWWAIGRLLMVL
jgi:hypothetical protein